MRKLGIYVQVPFCQTKCTYCNFHTGVVASSRFAPYVEAVRREIREYRGLLTAAKVGWGGGIVEKAHSQDWLCHEAVVDTVYIGGGTPSLLDPRSEEHTSELQSPDHLVCRLLLEKKKTCEEW